LIEISPVLILGLDPRICRATEISVA
jgi:hypothetical protein